MQYFKNKKLEPIFYINEKGLVCQEEFIEIEQFNFQIRFSNLGRIWVLPRLSPYKKSFRKVSEKILTASLDDKGYYRYCINYNKEHFNILLHRLIAIYFIPNPENKPEVNHIDGNTKNNHIWNLEWVTAEENIAHAFKNGLMSCRKGTNNNSSKLNDDDVRYIRECKGSVTSVYLAKHYGVNESTIYSIRNYHSWNHIQ